MNEKHEKLEQKRFLDLNLVICYFDFLNLDQLINWPIVYLILIDKPLYPLTWKKPIN